MTSETGPQKDGMDILQAWVDEYNARSGAAIPLESKGEAGGAQLRLAYAPDEGRVAIFHMVAVHRHGRPTILVRAFEGPTAEASVEAGMWASSELGRRPGG